MCFLNLRWLLLSVIVFFLDWLSKKWVVCNCIFGESIVISPFINFYYTYNFGIAFGLFSDFSVERNSILLCILILIITILIIMLCFLGKENDDLFVKVGYSIIIGGALGNFYDRVRYGAVVDFIDIYIGQYHWPTFNFSDLMIFVGAVLIVYFYK